MISLLKDIARKVKTVPTSTLRDTLHLVAVRLLTAVDRHSDHKAVGHTVLVHDKAHALADPIGLGL